MYKIRSVFIFSVSILLASAYAQEEDIRTDHSTIERQKKLFSSSIIESLKEAHHLKTKRQLYWTDQFHKAVKIGKERHKYLLLAFVGSDWCPWSQKLENEVLTHAKFAKPLKDDLLFVWVDFPENERLPEERKEINSSLKEKYNVKELPTLILLDDAGEQVCKFGYMALEAEGFANHIQTLVQDYKEMKELSETTDLKTVAQDALQSFYIKAKNLGCGKLQEEFMQAGLQIDNGTFFLLERYSNLLETLKIRDPAVQELRKSIVSRDPKNLNGTHFKLAMLEFNRLSNHPKKRGNPHAAIEPLMAYVKEFGKKDEENLWKVEMMIAQYFFSKGVMTKALQHATASYDSAPDSAKEEIAQSIDYLKSQKLFQ